MSGVESVVVDDDDDIGWYHLDGFEHDAVVVVVVRTDLRVPTAYILAKTSLYNSRGVYIHFLRINAFSTPLTPIPRFSHCS